MEQNKRRFKILTKKEINEISLNAFYKDEVEKNKIQIELKRLAKT